ncbi:MULTISPECIES: uroporphyrinogen-III synthase [unclassified Granulicatella]|uniref:uroporphyrinogen-III synthase n=1 Tax=unclassified Granulicatella TaxID=2630493 RepID=UPI001074835C|nr:MULTISPECIES: uroporphyrinogen-III synthase [unclassified Granulicatella]MBF0779532.1 uroporphyrinogen-III synthase [Granulicatella sp. 19428wC4_WM01]TFU96497.1 uroporphyrinogen-III synthase [Granulicatella sp. WM01]
MKRVIFTREHPLQMEWVDKLQQVGYQVEHVPLIKCQINAIPTRVYDELQEDDWVFFTSQVAANFFFEKAQGAFDNRAFHIATIGPQTSETVQAWGYSVTFESDKFYAKDLVSDWCKVYTTPKRIFIPQSSLAAKHLEISLNNLGHDVLAWVMYETIYHPEGQKKIAQYIDDVPTIWAFASGSAWDSFYDVQKELPASHEIAVIGTTTRGCVERNGHQASYMPLEPQIEDMVQVIFEHGQNS